MAILTRLVDWFCGDKYPKENIYVKNGIKYVRDIKKLSDEELEEIVVNEIMNTYISMLKLLDKKNNNKIVSFDSISTLGVASQYSLEFLDRNYIRDSVNPCNSMYDVSSLHRHFKVFGRPYTLSLRNGVIFISFIYNINPVKNSISEYTEEEIKSGSISQGLKTSFSQSCKDDLLQSNTLQVST